MADTVEELYREHTGGCLIRAFDEMVERNSSVGLLKCFPDRYRAYLSEVSPSVYALHNAAWSAGYTVNGVAP